MVSTPKVPTAPDPTATAAAQTATNVSTAQANAAMNNINQVTPYGNLTYSQSGQNFISDPNGQQYYVDSSGQYHTSVPASSASSTGTAGTAGHYETQHVGTGGHGGYDTQVWVPGTSGSSSSSSSSAIPDGWSSVKGYYVPSYTATQTLSPQQQAILDQTQQANLNLGTLANEQSAKMKDYLNTPLDLSSSNINKYINDNWEGNFNNQWDRTQSSLQQQLADQGVKLGSEAYSNAMRDYTTQKQSASDQYTGDMYNNAMQAILTQRNQPINEIGALLSGSQVTQPTYASGTSSSTIPTTDVAGITNSAYQNQMAGYNAQLQSSNAAMGGLFGLGSSLLGGWAMSDPRLKMNIEKIGTLANGINVYSYDYVWGERSAGVMADEVAEIIPDAVAVGPGGFLMVDYARVA